ncbi:MAG: hypothetical protein ACRC8Y_20990, partial [Chroococcales cyanobacterium]
ILLPSPQTEIYFTLTDFPDIEGFIQPVQLQDSYGVFLNIGYDDSKPSNTVEIPVLQRFNPNQILPFPQGESFLGQTLLLTLGLTPDNQEVEGAGLTKLANDCYQALFNQNIFPSHLGKLFGSPIFEYGNPRQVDESPHVLIWLFRDEIADKTLQQCFSSTFDLFFYRHKVTKAFEDSREVYRQLKQYYLGLDPTLDGIQAQIDVAQPDPLDNAYLQGFKSQLKQLSADSLIYDRLLRKMKDLLTTIDINCNNYNDKVAAICATLGTDKEELSFWRQFGENTAPQFRRQIEADLSYFEQGTGLMSQAVASIRAIVEIDQAQCDRTWQRWEKKREKRLQEQLRYQEERFLEQLHKQDQDFQKQLEASREQDEKANQKLQDQVQAVGVGIAFGAIFASTSALMFEEPIAYPWQPNHGDNLHPFTIAVLLSIGSAVVAWKFAKLLIGWGRN